MSSSARFTAGLGDACSTTLASSRHDGDKPADKRPAIAEIYNCLIEADGLYFVDQLVDRDVAAVALRSLLDEELRLAHSVEFLSCDQASLGTYVIDRPRAAIQTYSTNATVGPPNLQIKQQAMLGFTSELSSAPHPCTRCNGQGSANRSGPLA